jgi:hypothetical protein
MGVRGTATFANPPRFTLSSKWTSEKKVVRKTPAENESALEELIDAENSSVNGKVSAEKHLAIVYGIRLVYGP